MPVKSDDPLRRTTLNLYEDDCLLLEVIEGHGWTTYVRDLVHKDCNRLRAGARRRTLGDLPE